MLLNKGYLRCCLIISVGISIGVSAHAKMNACQAIFDAGSSGTRLSIFENQNKKWIEHSGPKVGALADPIRERGGRSWSDVDAVIAEVTNALEAIKNDGSDSQNQSKWEGFDWTQRCHLRSISVYATAGMRIAEQENPERALNLWEKLRVALKARYPDAQIQARTLTGFEEGLFAWMTLNQLGKGKDYGLIEMGGASTQIAFVCQNCPEAKPVLINDAILPIFSYSFLGQGGTEALTTMGAQALNNPACAFAAGKSHPDWNAQLCAATIPLASADGIADPYNYGIEGKGTAKILPEQTKQITQWYLAGSLAFYTDDDVEKYCVLGDSAFQQSSACFRAVYFQTLLDLIGIKQHQRTSTSWMLGAITCDEQNCLRFVPSFECNWMRQGCLTESAY